MSEPNSIADQSTSDISANRSNITYYLVLAVLFSAVIPTNLYPELSGAADLFMSIFGPDLLLALLIVNILLVLRYRQLSIAGADFWLLSLVGILVGSVLWSRAPIDGIRDILYIVLFLGLYLYISNSEPVPPTSFERAFILFSFFNASIALAFFISEGSLRGVGIGSWANHYSSYAEAALPFTIVALRRQKKRKRLFPAAAIILNVIVIIISMSRAGLLTLLLISGLFITFSSSTFDWKLVRKYAIPLSVVPIVVIIIGVYAAPGIQGFFGAYVSRISTISLTLSPELLRENLGASRYTMYSIAVDVSASNPIIGVGMGSFPPIMAQRYHVGLVVHNVFLNALVNAGIFALFALIMFMLMIYRSILTTFSNVDTSTRLVLMPLGVSFTAIIFHGLFRPVLASNPFFYITAGIIAMYYKQNLAEITDGK